MDCAKITNQSHEFYLECAFFTNQRREFYLDQLFYSALKSTEAKHKASRGPLKGAVSAQKALQGSETETRELLGGTEENSVSTMRDHEANQ